MRRANRRGWRRPTQETNARHQEPFRTPLYGVGMKPMTPAELHRLLLETIVAAHQELDSISERTDPAVNRARDILTSAINRVIHAAHKSYAERADVGSVVADIHDHRME